MQKMILVPVEQYNRIINGYDKTTEKLIGELLQMSEKEFDLFMDCIDWKRNKKLAKFAIWICNNRKQKDTTPEIGVYEEDMTFELKLYDIMDKSHCE